MISVVMALFNGEKFLKEQLDSIRNQTVAPDEVILCDDISSDKTVSICENYIKQYHLKSWKIQVNKTNLGYAENFRNGIKTATGNLIFLSDQDDIWHKEKIERILDLFSKNPEFDCIVSAIKFYNGQKIYKTNFFQCKKKSHQITQREIINHCAYVGCGMAFKKSSLSKEFFECKSLIAHDWAIMLDYLEGKKVFYYGKPLILHRIHEANTSLKLFGNSFAEKRLNHIDKMQQHYRWAVDYCKKKNNNGLLIKKVNKICDFFEIRKDVIEGKKNKCYLFCYFTYYYKIYHTIRPFFVDLFINPISRLLGEGKVEKQ